MDFSYSGHFSWSETSEYEIPHLSSHLLPYFQPLFAFTEVCASNLCFFVGNFSKKKKKVSLLHFLKNIIYLLSAIFNF